VASVTFTAPDISCDHCKRHIEGGLSAADGVRRVEVAIASKQVAVDYDESVTDPAKLRAALDGIGYPVSG
jgi:copper chaperone